MQELKFKIDSQREVVIMDIEKLIDNPNNVKIHTQEQIELIKKSIDKLGFNSIVVIDEENMIQNSDYAIACKLLNKRVLVYKRQMIR